MDNPETLATLGTRHRTETKKTNKHMLQKYIFETKLEKTLSEKDKSICDDEITVTECSDANYFFT
jgi:ribosome biogenesis protein Tsr3